jgi:tRNA/tmRNA/rRNA uracil-C5-methylase (TrmA/RlmC/RlmD family)
VPGGQAIGTAADGKKIFVWGALPDEEVEVTVTRSKKSYAEGILSTVFRPSSHRIEPVDDCYLMTSPWQTMDYRYELEQKANLIHQAFEQQKISADDITPTKPTTSSLLPITDQQIYHYRNKMEYALYWDNTHSQISLAFHQRGSHIKSPIDRSSIERAEIFDEAQRMVAELNAQGQPARRYQSLVVRCDQAGKVSSALFENHQPHPTIANLSDKLLGRKFTYSPNGFFQINLPVYQMALAEIKHHILPDRPIVDMYCGVGSIGLAVADSGQSLTLVETNRAAFRELTNNCQQYPLARSVRSDAENALKYITHDINLIVDPPRAGLSSAVVERIVDVRPKRIIYLRCNPVTQARDIAFLLDSYRVVSQTAYNFFPRTPHVENLIVLEQSK